MEKMTMEEYLSAREQVRATYGDSARASSAKRDQELARLYSRSGWTQRELAAVENLSQAHLEHKMRFGKFLDVISSEIKMPDLTEGRFRRHWYLTNKEANEADRFQEVRTMLERDAALPKPPRADNRLARQLKERFGDGKWHGVRAMTEALEATPEQVQRVLDGMRRAGAHHTYCERRKGGKNDGGWQYRLLLHNGHTIAYDVLTHELAPILDGLKEQGQKNQTSMVPHAVLQYALQIEKVLEKLAR